MRNKIISRSGKVKGSAIPSIKSTVDDAMLNFYLEADKDTIAETLQEVGDTDSYKEKRDKLISIIRAKAKTSK